jgi:hypothetical protein
MTPTREQTHARTIRFCLEIPPNRSGLAGRHADRAQLSFPLALLLVIICTIFLQESGAAFDGFVLAQNSSAASVPVQLHEAKAFYEKTVSASPGHLAGANSAPRQNWPVLWFGALCLVAAAFWARRLVLERSTTAEEGTESAWAPPVLNTDLGLASVANSPAGGGCDSFAVCAPPESSAKSLVEAPLGGLPGRASAPFSVNAPWSESPIAPQEPLSIARHLLRDLQQSTEALRTKELLKQLLDEFELLQAIASIPALQAARQSADALRALVRRLSDNPDQVSPETVRTLRVGVDSLEKQFGSGTTV